LPFLESRFRGNDKIGPTGRAEGQSPSAEGLGVSPKLNSLESLFDKEGLREFGDRGLI
jgi:hypothetical protein